VLRRTVVTDGRHCENTVEHSWHVAMMALVLPGDTFVYDVDGQESKAARERAAAERLFGLLSATNAMSCVAAGSSSRKARRPTPASPAPSIGFSRCCSTTHPPGRRGESTASPPSRSAP
jgi:hypothetical protein